MDDITRKRLDEKIERYCYWLIDYGHEAASMWAQGNVHANEVSEFNKGVKIQLKKKGVM